MRLSGDLIPARRSGYTRYRNQWRYRMKIVFSPAISAAAWEIGQALLPRGFTIEILAKDPEARFASAQAFADELLGFF